MHPLKLIIVDDHPLLGEGLKHLLSRQIGLSVVAVVRDYSALLANCQNKDIDLILMDVELEEGSGIEYTRQIKMSFPEIKVIGFSAHSSAGFARKMIEAGAQGYVLKESSLDELLIAIWRVAKGNSYFSNEIAVNLIRIEKNASSAPNSLLQELTTREKQILQYVVEEELTNKEIANELFISPRTVETHKRNLIQKLEVRNVIGLAKYYYSHLRKEKIF